MAGNKGLQGDVVLKYFELGPQGGRGGVVRNMLFVHDVQFEEDKIAPDEAWPGEKERLISSGECPIGALPVLYIDGKPYYGHVPILRYLAAKFDAVSSDPEVRHCSDVTIDEYINWRSLWGDVLFDEEKKKEYIEKREKLYALIEKLYGNRADKSTPYFMALEKPGYDDVAIYTMMYDDQMLFGKLDMEAYPTLNELYEKIQSIPRITEWTKEAATKTFPFA